MPPERLESSLRRCETFVAGMQPRGREVLALTASFLIAVLDPSPSRWSAVERLSEEARTARHEEWAVVEHTLVLLAGEIAQRCGCPVPALDDYRLAALEAVEAPAATTAFRAIAQASAARNGPLDLSATSPGELRKAATTYLTGSTADPVAPDRVSTRDRWLVAGHALDSLHRRNLEVASLLCRVLARWQWQPSGFRDDALAGFVACQHPDGYFGFDQRLLERAGEGSESLATDARARVTLVSLWAMGEIAVPGFLLLEPETWPEAGGSEAS
jgi:hypothetical protein